MAQEFADKEYYLVDSLVLDELTVEDKELLNASLIAYHKSKDDTTKINSLNDICENMMHEDWSKYQFYQYELIKKKLKTSNSNTIKKSYSRALSNIAFIYESQGKLKKSLEYYGRSLKLSEEIGDKKGTATCLNNVGLIYNGQGQQKEAQDYYERSIMIQEEIGDKKGLALSLNNLASLYNKQGKFKEALTYYNRSFKIRGEIGDKNGVAETLNNIGGMYGIQGIHNQALEYFERSLKIRAEIGDKIGVSINLINIGRTYKALEKLDEAKDYFNKSLEISLEIGSPKYIKHAARSLSEIYEISGNGMKALEMYKLYIKMKDSINNEETQKASIRQQTKYEFEKAQIVKENEAKEQERVLTEATGRRDDIQYSLIFLGILVLFGVILSLGFIKVSAHIAEGIIFFAFLILFEFLLVFSEPYLEQYTNGEPMYNLLANSVLALLIFPVHAILEKLLKKRIVK